MRWRTATLLLLVAAGVAVYSNTFGVPFLFDDYTHIVENPVLRRPLLSQNLFSETARPVVWITLALNYTWGGLRVEGYHAVNLMLHLLTGLVLFGILRRTFLTDPLRSRFGEASTGLALAASLLWLIHPLQTQAVTYIIQRGEVLAGLFQLLTLYALIRSAQDLAQAGLWKKGAVLACSLAMASKPTSFVTPLAVLLYDRIFLAGPAGESIGKRWKLYAALGAAWIVLAFCLVNGSWEFQRTAGFGTAEVTPFRYALTQTQVVLHYLRLSVWPHPLVFDYNWPIVQSWKEALPSLAGVGLLATATLWALRGSPVWGFSGAWFFLQLAPTSSFLPIQDAAFEYRMYLPLASLTSLLAAIVFLGLTRFFPRRPTARRLLAAGLLALTTAGLSVITYQRNRDYRSAVSLCSDTVAKRPQNPRAWSNWGAALAAEGRWPEAVECFSEALRRNSQDADAHNNLGFSLKQIGRLEEAESHFREALRLKPRYLKARRGLAELLQQQGRHREAAAEYERIGRVLFEQKRWKESAEWFLQAKKIAD